MRPETLKERIVKRLASRIHGDHAYHWLNRLANKISRLAR